MSIEEQEIEIDALRSIYPEEFELIEDSAPFKFKVILASQPVDCGPEDDPTEFETGLTFLARLPEVYPEVEPEYSFIDIIGLDDLELDSVHSVVKQLIEDNIGMSMVFAICSEIQSTLTSLSENKLKSKEAEADRKKKEAEEIELKRLIGTPVTVQTFLEWKAKFDEEIKITKSTVMKTIVDDKTAIKMTGKQLFLQDAKMDSSDLEFLETAVGTMEINESLFQDDEDFEIEDDELSDE
ncbi:RWD domain-containing protein 1-like [Symsagittifera roscoffensis]|uniref:RWD domain-containing protein 1-like n=1 Tax=Symsagittifera roscoffensis TaxID=84072 RepID=UPI00307B29CF